MDAQREELVRLMEELPEEAVPAVLSNVRARLALAGSWPPPWFGTATSGDPALSEHVDDVLAEGFGR
ncbi:hypothetical protein FHX37_0250 [Haloactinospora alba]|uniref:Uncharacterized protein n=1 Tax=Haloactinospora alba TaxID=405555 RepID=A0A543NEV2_9ACTN|nr:hypothetical protein [Haloactinospora alba]TQN30373.1 hypothetical protein FHX37_0250 [Haloactinospora alba]